MALTKKNKYKISIDPDSKNLQGLREGDIVRRQYLDENNLIYSLMAVIGTGVDTAKKSDGTDGTSPYFIGMLLDGVDPKSEEQLDFVRMTSLCNNDRGGAVYMTASDSGAPFISVVDKMGTEKSLCRPYACQLNAGPSNIYYGAYIEDSNGELVMPESYQGYSDCAVLTNLATSNFPYIQTHFNADVEGGDQLVISFYIYANKANTEIPVKLLQESISPGIWYYDFQTTVSFAEAGWHYVLLTTTLSANRGKGIKFEVHFPSSAQQNDTLAIRDLNIIKLADLSDLGSGNKVRVGKISDVVDDVMGTLNGYGVYTKNLYASGNVSVAGTLTAGDENGFGSTFYAGKIARNEFKNSIEPAFTNSIKSDLTPPTGIGSAYTLAEGTSSFRFTDAGLWNYYNDKKKYTFSFWAYSDGVVSTNLIATINTNSQTIGAWKVKAGWNRYSATFMVKYENDAIFETTICFHSPTASITIASPQLEKGEYATQYQATDETLSTDEGYGFWACRGGIGGTIQNPLLRLDSDGSLRSRDGNFYILADGTAYFKGTLEIGDKTSVDGTTFIKNGTINTTLLNVKEIYATNIETETIVGAYLNFQKGKIGGWYITDTMLTSETTEGKDHIELSSSGGIRNVVSNIETWGLRADGSGILASGNISWDVSGDLIVNKITATSGNIAGWNILANYLYSGTQQTEDTYAIDGITLFADGTSASIRAKNFYISTDGSAHLKGEVEATSGKISNWHIEDGYIFCGTKQTLDTYSTSGITFYAGIVENVEQASIRAKNFYIDTKGNAFFRGNGEFTGKITASSGSLGGWVINSDSITSPDVANSPKVTIAKEGDIYCELAGSSSTTTYWKLAKDGSGSLAKGNIFWKADGTTTFTGALNGATGSFSGRITASSGKIGGWTIEQYSLYGDYITLQDTDGISCYYDGAYRWGLWYNGSGQVASSHITWDEDGYFQIDKGRLGKFVLSQASDTIEKDMEGSLFVYYTRSNGVSTQYSTIDEAVSAVRASTSNPTNAIGTIYRTVYRAAGGVSVQICTGYNSSGKYWKFDAISDMQPDGTSAFGRFSDNQKSIYIYPNGSGRIGLGGNKISIDASGTVSIANLPTAGQTGPRGYSISNIKQTASSADSGGENAYDVYIEDGTKVGSFSVYNGKRGATGPTGPSGPSWSGGEISKSSTFKNGLYCSWHWPYVALTETNTNVTWLAVNRGDSFAFCRGDTNTMKAHIDSSGEYHQDSDIRIKNRIVNIQNVLPTLVDLEVFKYTYKGENKVNIGVSAQDVYKHFPELIDIVDNRGYSDLMSLNYDSLNTIFSIQGLKELYSLVKSQRTQIDDLERRLSAIESALTK